MNPLELQILVLVSGVPEASAGTVLAPNWTRIADPATTRQQPAPTARLRPSLSLQRIE